MLLFNIVIIEIIDYVHRPNVIIEVMYQMCGAGV